MNTSEFTDEYGDWLEGKMPGSEARWLDLTLGEMRCDSVLRVSSNTQISEAIELMNRHRASAVLVVDDETLVGIFTERDVLARVVPLGYSVFGCVAELMTRTPHTLSESTPLVVALRTLASGMYHHLPVVDNEGRPKGLVSLQTIVGYLADTFPNQILNAPPVRESYPPCPEGS